MKIILLTLLVSSCSIIQPLRYKLDTCSKACKNNPSANIVFREDDEVIFSCNCKEDLCR